MRKTTLKRTFKRTISFTLCLITVLSFCVCSAFADRFDGSQSYSTISPSGDMLRTVSTCYTLPLTISQSVTKPYQMNVIKFKTDSTDDFYHISIGGFDHTFANGYATTPTGTTSYYGGGYYCAYSTDRMYHGNDAWDTLGQVFTLSESGMLWYKTYTAKPATPYNDDDGEGQNFKLLFRLPGNCTYYFCTRAYNNEEAYYYLSVKPNDDKISSDHGGTWIVDSDGKYTPDGYISTKYEYKKQYFNKSQTISYYSLLWSIEEDCICLEESLQDGYLGILRTLAGACSNLYDLISIFVPADELVSLGITATTDLGGRLWTLSTLSPIQTMCMTLVGLNESEIRSQMADIKRYTNVNHSWRTATTMEWSVDHGMVITTYKNYCNNNEERQVSAYDSTALVGGKYEKGTWQ